MRQVRHLLICMTLLVVAGVLLVACGANSDPGPVALPVGGTGTVVTGGADGLTPMPSSVKPGPQACLAAVSSLAYWKPIAIAPDMIGTKIESVTCANLKGDASLQALVLVRYDGTGGFLDLHVYDNITNAHPGEIFKLSGLGKGNAKISPYNTVITSEVDANSRINKDQPNAALQADLYREYKWIGSHFDFVAFPGIYPDLTRYQAETDQQNVNGGADPWKLDAAQVANHLAQQLLKWPAGAVASIVSGGGVHDVSAVVNVKTTGTVSGTISVTLSRLEGNVNKGIWIAISVASSGLSIDTPVTASHLHSPFTVAGHGNAFEGVVGTLKVLNHLYDPIGTAQAKGSGNGASPYTGNMSYTRSSPSIDHEEGVLALYALSEADGSVVGAVMIKELLS